VISTTLYGSRVRNLPRNATVRPAKTGFFVERGIFAVSVICSSNLTPQEFDFSICEATAGARRRSHGYVIDVTEPM
jgi:hypothetical protein